MNSITDKGQKVYSLFALLSNFLLILVDTLPPLGYSNRRTPAAEKHLPGKEKDMALQLIKCGPEVPAGCEDIFRNSEIYTRYFQDGRLGRSLERYAQNGELYLACDESGRPLGAMKVSMRGFCGLYPYLGLLGVHADSRGLGVGAFLMEQLEKMALESGARRVTLMVSDFNLGGQRFYERLGYRKLGEIPDAAKEGITELLMIKDLK